MLQCHGNHRVVICCAEKFSVVIMNDIFCTNYTRIVLNNFDYQLCFYCTCIIYCSLIEIHCIGKSTC